MRVRLIQAIVTPVFGVVDPDGRVLRSFGLPEGTPWVLHFPDLAGLPTKVEEFEAAASARLGELPAAESRAEQPPTESPPPPDLLPPPVPK